MRAGLGPIITLALVLEVAWAGELKPTAPPIFTGRPFVVAWNVPTQECAPRHKVPLDLRAFDVKATPNEGFFNQNITTFYYDRLGLYPRFDAAGTSVHGGVPQNGSLCAHLPMLKESVERYIQTQEPGGWQSLTGRNGGLYGFETGRRKMFTDSLHASWWPVGTLTGHQTE